jgi:hypothetical protein
MQEAVSFKYSLLAGTFAFLDGCKLQSQRPCDALQEVFYNGWQHKHCVDNMIVFSFAGDIIHAAYGARGTVHDQTVFNNSALPDLMQDMDQDNGLYPVFFTFSFYH